MSMDRSMTEPSDAHHDNLLIDRAAAGDEAALAELFGRYRKRLRAMVRLRMDRRLQGRVDPSDVLQEAYFDVAQQLPSYCANPEMLFYLWLRLTTGQRLMCTAPAAPSSPQTRSRREDRTPALRGGLVASLS